MENNIFENQPELQKILIAHFQKILFFEKLGINVDHFSFYVMGNKVFATTIFTNVFMANENIVWNKIYDLKDDSMTKFKFFNIEI